MKPSINITIISLLILVLAGCSGGGAVSSNSTRVNLKIGGTGTKTFKTSFAGSVSSSATSYIPSVVKRILVTVSAADMTSITAQVLIESPTQLINLSLSVPNGSSRTVSVVAEDNHGLRTYSGSSSPFDLNGTTTDVAIQMEENIAESIKSRLYQYFKDTIAARGANLGFSDLDPFYAVNFGLDDGDDRTAVINRELKDFKLSMTGMVMTSLQIDSVTPDSANQKYTVKGKGFFADGSFGFPDGGFIMLKENGEWCFAGNGFKSEVKFRGGSVTWAGTGSYESGLFISVHDKGNVGINSAVVTGPGLPGTGLVLQRVQNSFANDLTFNPPNQPVSPGMFDLYALTDATISAIPPLSLYTFVLYDINGTEVERRSYTLPERPLMRGELTPSHFASLLVSPVSSFTNGHYLADSRIGSSLAITYSKPTAFAPSWLQSHLNCQGWNSTTTMGGVWVDRSLLLTDTYALLPPTPLQLISLGAEVAIEAEDFDRRREFRTVWLFNGPPNTGTLNFSSTSNTYLAGGVTLPAAASVWKFGGVAQTVSWTGFLASSQLDIYLLADDPARVAVPAAFGNPFPTVIWAKLNVTALSAAAGSFTVPHPEVLGLAGAGCRIIVVSGTTGEWALSAPFTISP